MPCARLSVQYGRMGSDSECELESNIVNNVAWFSSSGYNLAISNLLRVDCEIGNKVFEHWVTTNLKALNANSGLFSFLDSMLQRYFLANQVLLNRCKLSWFWWTWYALSSVLWFYFRILSCYVKLLNRIVRYFFTQ